MNENILVYGDTYKEYNEMLINVHELNTNLINIADRKSLYDLFIYMVSKGYDNDAADLWETVIKKDFIVKPL